MNIRCTALAAVLSISALLPVYAKSAAGTENTKKNLLNNGTFSDPKTNPAHWYSRGCWGGASYAHGGTPVQKKEVPLLAQRKVVNGAVYLCMPEAVKKYCVGNQTMHISNCIAQDVDLAPSPKARKMRVKIRAKGKQIAVKQIPSLFRISINTYFLNKAKRQTPAGKMVYKNFPLKDAWQEMSFDFTLPANAQRVSVSLPLYGVGECYIDDAELFFID